MAERQQPIDLEEAEGVLSSLASTFFSAEGIEQAIADFLKNNPAAPAVESPGSAARYKALVEQIPAVIFVAPMDEGVGEAWVSPHIETALGFTQEEWLNDPFLWFRQVHPDDRDKWVEGFAQTCANDRFGHQYPVAQGGEQASQGCRADDDDRD